MEDMMMKNDKGKKMEMADMHMNSGQMPMMKNWEVGKTYTVKMKVKMLSKSETHKDASYSGEGMMNGGFKIMSMEDMHDSKEPANMDSKEHKKYMADERAKAAKMM